MLSSNRSMAASLLGCGSCCAAAQGKQLPIALAVTDCYTFACSIVDFSRTILSSHAVEKHVMS